MRKVLWAMALSAVMFNACDDDDDNNDNAPDVISGTDLTFVNQATYINRGEVQLGALAAERSQTQSIIDFGSMMVQEHQIALEELDEIVDDYDNDLPNGLDKAHQDLKDTLMTLSGAAFDSVFIANMAQGHAKAVTLFESQASSGKVERLRNYANKYLPAIREHRRTADSLYNALEVDEPQNDLD